ncbi:unnamed protein product [Ectocarpus sp. CCAP 1310/34]|nr:unnamed protein product [Ectocarpus sp. CCAP 1310/34]
MRAEFRIAKKNKEKSGNNAEHYWSFCNQKLYVLLMMDWYELRGGDSANEHCARYLSVKLNEEDGEAFNTLSMEDQQSSSDSDEPLAPKRKPRERKDREKGGGGGHAGFSPDQALTSASAKRREVFGESHEGCAASCQAYSASCAYG